MLCEAADRRLFVVLLEVWSRHARPLCNLEQRRSTNDAGITVDSALCIATPLPLSVSKVNPTLSDTIRRDRTQHASP